MIGYIIAIVLLLACSAFFSSSETAFTSLSKVRMKNRIEDGDLKAKEAMKLAERYDDLLSSILIGNNMVNITAASLGTMLFVSMLGADIGVTVATVVITILTLIFGEVSPKALAKENPERVAIAATRPLAVVVWLFTPLNFFFRQLKRWLQKLVGHGEQQGITEEELLTMVDFVEEGGNIDAHEGELIRSAIEFDDLQARDIFTPRVRVSGVEDDESFGEIAAVFSDTGFTRLPVYHESIDNIIGVLHLKDFFNNMVAREQKTIEQLIKPAVFISLNMKISRLMGILQKNQSHMAIVTDEYGGTVGIVTLEDIIEELVGEIWDEHDVITTQVQQIRQDTYIVDGAADVDDLFAFFNLEVDEDEIEANSVSGWVMDMFGHIPVQGETFTYGPLEVIVEDATRRHVERIEIILHEQARAEED